MESNIWEQIHDGLRAFIAKRVRNETETEDLLQEVFLRVHQNVESLQEPERMVSWVFQITRNASLTTTDQRSADGNCQPALRRLSKIRTYLPWTKRMKLSTSFHTVFAQ